MESTAVSVKVSFNGEMRRFPFQGTSFALLQEHIIELLGLEKTAEITLKYADEENDLITISSDLELKSAIVPGQLLRLEAIPKRAAVQSFVAQPVAPQPVPLQGEAPTPFGGDQGWSYHHGPHAHFAGNDWQAFKELRKQDKKAFSREEWAAFKEQRKKEKKDLKEHLKEQKEWLKKERKEFGNWRGGSHPHHHHGGRGHHAVPPYFGHHAVPPYFGPHHLHPHPHAPSSPHPHHDSDGEVTMTDVPIDDRSADQPLGVHAPPFGLHPPPFAVHPPPFGAPPGFGFPHPHPPFGFPHPGFGPGFGGVCQPSKLVARHVKDVTVEDGMKVAASSSFVKTWRVRNEGAPWPAGCSLLFLNKHGGDSMSAPEKVLVEGPVGTNQEVDISVSLVAPAKPGRYTGYWKMCSPDGRKFGQRMWVTIVVPSLGSSSSEGEKEADRYEALVDSVLAMGFDVKRHRVFRLLQKHNGDVALVCQALSDKASKSAQKDADKAQRRALKDAEKAEKALRKSMKD
jgi:hypothetical protein